MALALVRLGLVTGSPRHWRVHGVESGATADALHHALDTLAVDGALEARGDDPIRLSVIGEALHGPDLRQRHWLSIT